MAVRQAIRAAAVLAVTAGALAADEPSDLEWEIGPATLALSGWLNLGVLHWRDGEASGTWAPVDNDIDASRARLEVTAPAGDWEFLLALEGEYHPRPSGALSLADGAGWDWSLGRENIRHIEVRAAHERWGRLWLGQGDMASEDVIEDTDLSGTGFLTWEREDLAGAQVFRLPGGDFSGLAVDDAFAAYDGLGRAVRVRYDTPEVAGLRLMAAYGQDRLVAQERADLVDLGLRWSGEQGDFDLAAAAGIGWRDGERTSAAAITGLHEPTGWTLTLGAAEQEAEGRYVSVKLGWQRDLIEAGRSYVAVDHYRARDVADEEGSRSSSWGLSAVQDLDERNLQLWLTLRRFEASDATTSYQPGRLIFGGVRVWF